MLYKLLKLNTEENKGRLTQFFGRFRRYYKSLNPKSKNKIINKLNEAIVNNKIYMETYSNKRIYKQKNIGLKSLVEKLKKLKKDDK